MWEVCPTIKIPLGRKKKGNEEGMTSKWGSLWSVAFQESTEINKVSSVTSFHNASLKKISIRNY